ncbi:hypothetical protein [Methylophilus sp. TWE2]|uniref:hypothetical protein n=1 Tax=Methylophilus sp. TWE2 TaxID=1662285 RepID=UPI0006709E00|nr:hypothetical protein [Methylophilus sp. TWE2]AKR42346.1 hypothetical protein ACJ67_02055 [Methylophilus sp. TWE2]
MNSYRHHISGVFEQMLNARLAKDALIEKGILESQISITKHLTNTCGLEPNTQPSYLGERLLLMSCIGAINGIFLACLVELALVIMDKSLLHSKWGVSTMFLLCSGVIIGTLTGMLVGAMMKDDRANHHRLSQLPARSYQWIRMLMSKKKIKLSVMTYSIEQTAIVAEVMHHSAHDYCDLKILPS